MLEVCRIPARWHGYVVSGVFFLLFGIVCLLLTHQVLSVILLLFSAIAILIGVLLIAAGLFVIGFRMQWVPLLFSGIILVIIGLFSVYYPDIVSTIAIYLIAGIFLLLGILMITYGAISFVETKTRIMIILLGLFPVLIGLYMMLYPGIAAALVLSLWGIFSSILGIVLIIQGLILRRVNYELGCNEGDT